MSDLVGLAGKLTKESSIIFGLLLVAGVVVLFADSKSLVGLGLVSVAVLIGVLGFILNFIKEGYDEVIAQKNEIINELNRQRKNEIKHSASLRREMQNHATQDWTTTHKENENNAEVEA